MHHVALQLQSRHAHKVCKASTNSYLHLSACLASEKDLHAAQVLWQALKPGGIYVVEDLSENYIEKPFLDKGTFTDFMKTAIDIVQCR